MKMVTAEWSHSGDDLEISIKPKRLDYTNVPNQIQKDQIIQMCQIIEHFGWISANIIEGGPSTKSAGVYCLSSTPPPNYDLSLEFVPTSIKVMSRSNCSTE